MESVKTRSLEMNILMAKLHRNSGYSRGAIAFYKECLRSVSHFLSQHSLTLKHCHKNILFFMYTNLNLQSLQAMSLCTRSHHRISWTWSHCKGYHISFYSGVIPFYDFLLSVAFGFNNFVQCFFRISCSLFYIDLFHLKSILLYNLLCRWSFQTSSRSTKVSLDQIDPTRWLQVRILFESVYKNGNLFETKIINIVSKLVIVSELVSYNLLCSSEYDFICNGSKSFVTKE